MSQPPFERTVCACSECVAHCKRQPGPLAVHDLERVDNDKLCASPGAVVGRAGRIFSIGTIVPKTKADGTCVFLDEQDRCTIHATAPFGCAYFDAHMGRQEAFRRASWYLTRIETSETYRALRASLPSARTWNPWK